MMGFGVTFSLLIFNLFVSNISSFPEGAGGCAGGTAAVGGAHVSGSFERLTLADAGVKVKIDGNLLSEDKTVVLPADTNQEIRVEAAEFVGVLIRVEAPKGANILGALQPGTDVGRAFACVLPVVGVTHVSRAVKSFVNGTLALADNWKGVQLDITVVLSLLPDSRFAHGTFKLDYFGSPTSAPTITRPPTLRPIRPPEQPAPSPRRRRPRTMAPTNRPTRRRRRPRTSKPTQRPTRRRRIPRTTVPT